MFDGGHAHAAGRSGRFAAMMISRRLCFDSALLRPELVLKD